MHNFRELQIWQKSIKLVKEVYLCTAEFPSNEQYGLTSQIRRCSVSIPSNIAEGSSRKSNKDFHRFLRISIGSAFELETQLIIANELGLVNLEKLNALLEELVEIQKMINGFEKSLLNAT
ncbi:MAG: four helix bundle protein [Cyclobacteriaceae bacterium]